MNAHHTWFVLFLQCAVHFPWRLYASAHIEELCDWQWQLRREYRSAPVQSSDHLGSDAVLAVFFDGVHERIGS